jgi:biofilm PGA synthesis N-glycosyltransferase PgaC
MATEDIDLTWKLLMAGWQTAYEPHALVGMQVPVTLRGLWAQRKRWARGQGEVLHTHLGAMLRWRNHRLWLMALESLASLAWVIALVTALVLSFLSLGVDNDEIFGFAIAWGVAVAFLATIQVTVALWIDADYDPRGWRAYLIEPVYPLAYWLVAAAAALRAQTIAFVTGVRGERVVWHIPREPVEPPGRGLMLREIEVLRLP